MMSSEEEATAANVLSQMSQIQQIPCETIEATVINVGHQCDVETTAPQEPKQESQVELDTAELVQQVQLAVQGAPVTTEFDKTTTPTVTTSITTSVTAHSVAGRAGKVYPCEYCGKEFNKSYNLKTHIRVHTGERPYQCEVCAHGFANLGDLKRHSRTHTGEKPFRCEYCSKVFSDFGSHKRHLRLHTGFKPFRCEHCDREFTRLDSYKNHVRLHTGDRPYKCDSCGKEFNYLTTYKRHLNIHKGEKPYPCDQCEKKFTRLNYLKNHLSTHSKLSTQECQTEVSLPMPTDTSEHQDEEMQADGGTTEEVVAAENLKADSTVVKLEDSMQVKESSRKGNGKQNLSSQDVVPDTDCEKTPDSSLLQQVTQVLGEIVPHNVSAEVTEGASGPQIVVQGVDGTGGEFKITLAQQLLIAQHLLNQGQFQRVVQGNAATADGDQPQITTVTIPELSVELAQQIVSQAGIQQTPQTSTATSVSDSVLVQNAIGMDLEESSTVQSHDDTAGMVAESGVIDVSQEVEQSVQVSEEVVAQGSNSETQEVLTGTMLQESSINSIPVAVSSQDPTQFPDNAVYVAIDPSQTDVQQLLGQIQVVSAEMTSNENQAVTEG